MKFLSLVLWNFSGASMQAEVGSNGVGNRTDWLPIKVEESAIGLG
jgi:hypothetical protein